MTNIVPFYANTQDDTHCVQAAFRIMLKHFLPERDFTFKQLDTLSKKQPGKGTWWFPALIEFKKMGLQVKEIGSFDYARYYHEGPDYLKQIYSEDVAEWYLMRSNVVDAKKYIPEFLDLIDVEQRPASINDIKQLLADGWLIGLDINPRVLNDKAGYSSHMVVIVSCQNDTFILHDPGLPPRPNRRVTEQKLFDAWSYAGSQNMSLVALKSHSTVTYN
jgi:hypothetical protein